MPGPFQITIHARPTGEHPCKRVSLAGQRVRALCIDPAELQTPWNISFEQAYEALERLPRMFIEPDGSFVWVSTHDELDWQLDGVLYDRAGRLALVDLKGTCPTSALDQLLTALGWPEQELLFALSREGVLLDEAEFRRFAAR